jgi:ABC-type microcin C transport system permease subunit YejE
MNSYVLLIILLFILFFLLFIIATIFSQEKKKLVPKKYIEAFKKYNHQEYDDALITAFIAMEIMLKNYYKSNNIIFHLINKINDRQLKSDLHKFRLDRNLLIHESKSVSKEKTHKHLKTLEKLADKLGYKAY